MERRALIKGLLGGTLWAAAFSLARQPTGRKFGLLSVDGHRAHKLTTGETLRVWVNGCDVTRECHEADDTAGYALVYCRDSAAHRDLAARGAMHVGADGGVCDLRLTGDVVIAPGPPL